VSDARFRPGRVWRAPSRTRWPARACCARKRAAQGVRVRAFAALVMQTGHSPQPRWSLLSVSRSWRWRQPTCAPIDTPPSRCAAATSVGSGGKWARWRHKLAPPLTGGRLSALARCERSLFQTMLRIPPPFPRRCRTLPALSLWRLTPAPPLPTVTWAPLVPAAARTLSWLSRLSAGLAATPPCCSVPPRPGVCDTAALRHARHLAPSAASRRLCPHRRRPRSPSVALPRFAEAAAPPSSATLLRRLCGHRHDPYAVASLTDEPPLGAVLYPPTRRVAWVLSFLRAWTTSGAVSWLLRGGVRRRRPQGGRGGGGMAHPDRLSPSPPTPPSSSSPTASAPKQRCLSLPSCLLSLFVAVLPPPLAEFQKLNSAGMGLSYPAANGG